MEISLVFSAGIDPVSCNNFASMLTKMANQGVERLTIGINCNGGNVQSGIFLYNILMSMPFDVVTHNIGNVDSIANAIFLAGRTRYSTRSATFMFHGVAFDLNGNVHARGVISGRDAGGVCGGELAAACTLPRVVTGPVG